MTTTATPSPPPPTATAPPLPRRSSTCDGSSRAPGRNLTSPFLLQVAQRERSDSRRDHEHEVDDRPCEKRCARLVRSAKRAELEHVLGEAGRVDRQAVQSVLVERVERQDPRRQARDVLQTLRLDRLPDLS